MNTRFIATFLATAAFITATPTTFAQEVTPTPTIKPISKAASFLLNPFLFLVKNKTANSNVRNEIIEQKKAPRSEGSMGTTTSIEFLGMAIQRLDDIANRLDSRVKKIETESTDLSEVTDNIAKAHEKIDIASTTLELLSTTTASVSTTTQGVIETVLSTMGDAHTLLEKATQSLNEKK